MAEQGKETSAADAPLAPAKPRSRSRGSKCCVLLVVLVAILLVAAAVVIPTVVVSMARSKSTHIRGVQAIALACNATRFPQTCNASLTSNSSSLASVPQGLAAAAVAAAAVAVATTLTNATTLSIDPETMLNATYGGLVDDCLNTLALAQEHLAASSATLSTQSFETLDPKFATLCTSLSGALTLTGTCSDGLSRISSPKGAALRQRANLTFEIISNALAIINTFAAHGEDLDSWQPTYFLANLRDINPPSPSRRRILESTPTSRSSGPSSFPNWLDRRALLADANPDPNATVARDGSGTFTTIQQAVDATPLNGTARFVIRIKAGVYDETVRISSLRKHVMFLGDGVNVTIITGNRSVSMAGMTTFKSATVGKNRL